MSWLMSLIVPPRELAGRPVDGLRGFGQPGHEFGDVFDGTLHGGGAHSFARGFLAVRGLLQQPYPVQRPGRRGGLHEPVHAAGTDLAVRAPG
ncbi:hypothetical protein ACFYM7_35690 [Streptomyces cyaneofuscatus]|uniref:hypothetical protein n=1 Tax=Streptomyces cyaneofuscatus TaxID=66883 RepID=UPI00367FF551